MEQEHRTKLIRQASELPKGDAKRREILGGLQKEAVSYNGDPNVSLEGIYHTARKSFCEDVAKAIIRYSTLQTPLKGKPGGGFSRNDVAYHSIMDRDTKRSVSAEVMVRGKHILVSISDTLENYEKKWKFPLHDTPASIAADTSWYGKELLLGEAGP